jgi:hypothetical protein
MTNDLLNIKSFDRRRVLQGIAGGFAAAGTTTLFAPAVRAGAELHAMVNESQFALDRVQLARRSAQ